MADQLDIIVKEEGAAAAATKMRSIASSALKAGENVGLLQKALKSLKMGNGVVTGMAKTLKAAQDIIKAQSEVSGSASRLQAAELRLATQAARTATAQQKLATEIQKTQTAITGTETAIQRMLAAESLAAIAATRLTAEQIKVQTATAQLGAANSKAAQEVAKLATAQNNAATAAQRLATEQQRTATAVIQASTATAQAATAQNNAATAAQRLSTEQQRTLEVAGRVAIGQQNLAAATAKAGAAQTNATTAAAKLATEQQRTATAAANAANAANRAALSALKLAEAQKRAAQETNGATGSLLQYARAAAAAAGVSLGGGGILRAADAYTTLQNKLVNVTTSLDQVNELTERLFDIANRTRSGVEATATSFARFDRALRTMGKSQEDTLRMSETINKALIVSGATAQEASSALLQLSQGFNAGRLMGDEFRSVAENMPAVLDAVAKVLDRPINQIKKLASEGKITSKVLFDAFTLMQAGVDATFAKTTPTMGQGLVVLRNSFTKFTGEVDKATGVSNAISKSIIFLAANMKTLAVITGIAGTAMLVAYGPALLGALNKARIAMLGLNAAMLANPIGLIALGIVAATLAVIAFGDEVTINAKKTVTLKDAFRTAWNYISDGATVASGVVKQAWNATIDWLNKELDGGAEQFRDMYAAIIRLTTSWANTLIGGWVAVFTTYKVLLTQFPELFRYAFTKAVNYVSVAISQILNLWVDGLNLLSKGLASFAPDLAAKMNAGLEGLRITLPQIDMGDAPKNAAAALAKGVQDALGKDYVGDISGAFMRRAEKDARQRRIAEGVRGGSKTTLRGTGEDTSGGEGLDGKAAKAAEKRAAALAKVNSQLDNELSRMAMLKPVREEQAKFDAIEERMIGKKITLTSDEVKSIKEKIRAIQSGLEVQQAMDAIYETAIAPLRNYNNETKAAKLLLDQGAISQQDYAKAVVGSTEAYLNAVDPLRQFNKEMEQQNALLNLNPKDRAVEAQMQQLANDLLARNVVLTKEQTDAIRQQLAVQQQKNDLDVARAAIYDSTTGATDALLLKQEALNLAYASGAITQGFYASQMAQTNVAMAELQNNLGNGDIFSVFTAGIGQAIQGFTTLATAAADIIGNVMTGAIDGVSSSIANAIVKGEDLKASLVSVAQTIVTEMIGALIKMGIQYVINSVMATTALTTQTGASVLAAGVTAAAWAPAAAAVSLATLGTNSVPAISGMAAANVASKAFSMAGFQTGGYTGDEAVNKAVGFVHGQEFVMNAAATKRIGVDNLEAIQNGDMSGIRQSQETSAGSQIGRAHV